MAKETTVEIAARIAEPVLESLSLRLWDVRFEKEGSDWFLRYYIDKPEGVDINDCENFSRAIDPVLDREDPIDKAYCLEVSSPGIERELTKAWHFEESIGEIVKARLIRPKNNVKEVVGKLVSYEGNTAEILDEEANETYLFEKSELAFVRIFCDF